MAVLSGFIGPTYALRSIKADCQRCIGLIPELIESRNAANGQIGVLLGQPGRRRLATIGTGPIRGTYFTSTGNFAVVSGNELYSVDADWAFVLKGTLATSTGPVDMADNGQQLIVVDGANGYIASLMTGIFEKITAEGFLGANRVTFVDGYFIVNNPGTGQFCLSELYDGVTWDPLMVGTAEGSPDIIVGVISNNRQVWAMGSSTCEAYWNSGGEFPLSRIDGSFIEIGCAAAQTPQKFAGTIVWLGSNGQVLMANGFQPARISNHTLELAIRQAGDVSTASAWVYSQDGHTFYCLNLPGTASTWCYDLTTGQWHERVELLASGALGQDRVSCHAYAYSTHVVGDAFDGRIYALDLDVYSNDGDVLVSERTGTHFSQEMHRKVVSRFEVEMDSGVGLDGTQQGTDPQVMLQISKDGGSTWGTERWVSAGAIGNFRHRAIWRRLGMARDWVFRVRITDPVKRNIVGAFIDSSLGVS